MASQPFTQGPWLTIRQTWLDSFDWRLHRRGWELLHEVGAGPATLELRAHGGPEGTWPGPPVRIPDSNPIIPTRPADLPPGRLHEAVAGALGVRCLVPVGAAVTTRSTLRMLDNLQKTVAWVVAENSSLPDGTPLGARVRVTPVVGYPGAAQQVSSLLGARFGLLPGRRPLCMALTAAGRRPGDYSSKLSVALRSSDSFNQAVGALLGHLLSTVTTNLPGARANLDPEFLHDIRVAARRARSLLGEAAAWLTDATGPPGSITHLREELAWLGEVTGPTRDLDVWLLGIDKERSDGSPLDGELSALRQVVESLRVRAHRQLISQLESERFAELVRIWASTATQASIPGAPASTPPGAPASTIPGAPARTVPGAAAAAAGVVAAQLVRRAHRRVLKGGRAIGADSPDEALHDLRKAAKRLRYLLESFETLCPSPLHDKVVSELRALQDNLGELQDCAVQAQALARLSRESDVSDAQPGALIAIGYLISGLEGRRARARQHFAEQFSRFERPQARRLVASLASSLEAPPQSQSR